MTDEGQDGAVTAPPRLTLADLRALTPTDLRDLSELRREHDTLTLECARRARDQSRLEEENGYLRAQFAEALAGWRSEQRRTRESQPPPAPTAAAVDDAAEPAPTGLWARLWAWLAD